jgi:hypothetical protein
VWSTLPIPDPCGKFGKWLAAGIGAVGGLLGLISFPEDTLMHVRPAQASDADAQAGRVELKPIGQLKPGERVLSVAEWKDAGRDPRRDARLAYDTVTEVIESHRPQTLVHLTLDTGETLSATAGHALKTPDTRMSARR